jgi:arylsulfatase A-like enzyme
MNSSTKLPLFLTCAFMAFDLGAAAQKPNVLFISVDDLNDWAGYSGHSHVISPNMDRLADDGVWFSRAYCQYAVCGPSRASLMSGLYPPQLDGTEWQSKRNLVYKTVEAMGSRLLHTYLQDHGYKTMSVGKVMHRHQLPESGLDLDGGRGGFDHNKDANGEPLESNWFSSKTLTDWAVYSGEESEMSDSKAAQWAVKQLKDAHEEPFMLMVGFFRPHAPWHVPQKYFDLYDPDMIPLPAYRADDFDDVPPAGRASLNEGYPRTEWAIQENQWRNILHAYLASISFVDAKIGMVLEALESSPYRDNTIVILWSDNGYHLGTKNTFQKHTLWERSARVPLIIKAPGGKARGRSERIVSLLDLYPTLLELCGLPPNDKVMGRSLVPLLKNPDMTWDFPALTYGRDGSVSIRTADYRYIQYGDGSMELYSHQTDPHEWMNLVADPDSAGILRMLQENLNAHHVRH